MQSRNSEAGVTYCSVETMSSDSDLVDITSVSVHHQMYDHCATNCLSDELADDYVYDDDDFDDETPLAGGDNNASSTSVVRTDVSNIPSTNGVVDVQSSLSIDKSAVPVAGKSLLQPPFGFPLRSQTEIMSRAMELIDVHVKRGSEHCASNNNSFQHDNAECFKRAVNSVNHRGDGDAAAPTAEAAETYGKVLIFYASATIRWCQRHYISNVVCSCARAPIRACVCPSVMFLQYLWCALIDFRQTFVSSASWDKGEMIKFWGQKVNSQGSGCHCSQRTMGPSRWRHSITELSDVFHVPTILVLLLSGVRYV